MPSQFGTTLTVSVFGQSHSEAIGCVINGFPAGMKLDRELLAKFSARRKPGAAPWSTPRQEADEIHFVSGLNKSDQTCGAPICAFIANTNTHASAYKPLEHIYRPGHADFSADQKWKGVQDIYGGGHFSGRLTAPLCIAGALAKQYLNSKGIRVYAHISSVGDVYDTSFCAFDTTEKGQQTLANQLRHLEELHTQSYQTHKQNLSTLSADAAQHMQELIEAVHRDKDSVGGSIECVVCGVPKGVGSPMFDGLENMYARALFGIPAVKGVEFGKGFGASTMRGSMHNDAYFWDETHKHVVTHTNFAGGMLGGISTGNPILVHVGIKPTPSIARLQHSVDTQNGKEVDLEIHGRHDPCIVPRACVVVEAVCALVTLDALISYPAGTSTPNNNA